MIGPTFSNDELDRRPYRDGLEITDRDLLVCRLMFHPIDREDVCQRCGKLIPF